MNATSPTDQVQSIFQGEDTMNYESIESDILNYIGEGFKSFGDLDPTPKYYLAGMVASSQDMKLQMEIMNESMCDHAELPHFLFNAMVFTGAASSKASLSFASSVEADVLRYLKDGLTKEYNRLYTKYHSHEEVAARQADEEDKIL